MTLRHTASQPGTGQWNILTFAASGDTAAVIRAEEDAVHVLLSRYYLVVALSASNIFGQGRPLSGMALNVQHSMFSHIVPLCPVWPRLAKLLQSSFGAGSNYCIFKQAVFPPAVPHPVIQR